MRKIIFIILLIVALIGIKSVISYSAPDRNIQGQASDELEEIKNKLSTLEEEISYLDKEISRDKDISSWGQNVIAIRLTRDYLNRDLPEKKRILDNLKRDFGDELKDEIGFISQNIEKENEIVSSVRVDINEIKYTQAYISGNIQRKTDIINGFKEKSGKLKDKLEKAKKEETKK